MKRIIKIILFSFLLAFCYRGLQYILTSQIPVVTEINFWAIEGNFLGIEIKPWIYQLPFRFSGCWDLLFFPLLVLLIDWMYSWVKRKNILDQDSVWVPMVFILSLLFSFTDLIDPVGVLGVVSIALFVGGFILLFVLVVFVSYEEWLLGILEYKIMIYYGVIILGLMFGYGFVYNVSISFFIPILSFVFFLILFILALVVWSLINIIYFVFRKEMKENIEEGNVDRELEREIARAKIWFENNTFSPLGIRVIGGPTDRRELEYFIKKAVSRYLICDFYGRDILIFIENINSHKFNLRIEFHYKSGLLLQEYSVKTVYYSTNNLYKDLGSFRDMFLRILHQNKAYLNRKYIW